MRALRWVLDVVFPPRRTAMLVHALTHEALMRNVRIGRHVRTGITHLLSYKSESVRACIVEAKFHGNAKAYSLLGWLLYKYLQLLPTPHILIPIPLSRKRLKERGYNQVEKVLSAGKLGYKRLLVRTRDTVPQTSLPREARKPNLSGAFMCESTLSPIPIYVVVDDVTTTGSTLLEAKRALQAAGASKILLISLSH